MPIYDYFCDKCDRSFEKMTSINNRDNVACIDCDNNYASRKISACNYNVMKGTDSEIERAVKEQNNVCKDEKFRVKKALHGLIPKKDDTKCGPMGCVHQTRLDLKDRYGDIL
ncbi:MAG: hypothetical protein COB02_15825 [Candidatus Cloacimonadota bacterium]|nr:MAG: hypothetical protein COB02_15825 [Candidatus Cloacimonadota bacterium]